MQAGRLQPSKELIDIVLEKIVIKYPDWKQQALGIKVQNTLDQKGISTLLNIILGYDLTWETKRVIEFLCNLQTDNHPDADTINTTLHLFFGKAIDFALELCSGKAVQLYPQLIKKALDAPDLRNEKNRTPSSTPEKSCFEGISMIILGGVIAVAGIAVVALAFTLLSTPALYVAAGIGAGLALIGFGFFAYGNHTKPENPPESDSQFVFDPN